MRLGNRTYRVYENVALPKYFLKLHTVCATKYKGTLDAKNFIPLKSFCNWTKSFCNGKISKRTENITSKGRQCNEFL